MLFLHSAAYNNNAHDKLLFYKFNKLLIGIPLYEEGASL